MSKLFIFGIGGTGSRVIKAMTMLFTSGIKLPNGFDQVVPIIIDPDSSNGDMVATKNLLKRYCELRKAIGTPKHFFQQEIISVSELNGVPNGGSNPFELGISETSQNTFGQYISVNTMSHNPNQGADDQSFVKALYSQANLNANLSVGFKGNPNMGAVVMSQIVRSQDFLDFCQTFKQGDAMFTINSIFGGTGAAGFPLLLKNLRTNANIPNNQPINNAIIGDITFLPYYTLTQPNGGYQTVNPNTFDEKAKVALEYYNTTIITTNQIERIYFVGNQNNQNPQKYSEGGSLQRNNAHFLEMAGALAVYNFCKSLPSPKQNTQVMEFGIKSDNDLSGLDFSDLDVNDEALIAPCLTRYKLFTDYLKFGLERAIKTCRWTQSKLKLVGKGKKSVLDKDFFSSSEYASLKQLNNDFDSWLDEMANNKPSFAPFHTVSSNDLMKLRKDKSPKSPISCKDIDCKNAELILSKDYGKSSLGRLINMFADSTGFVCEKQKII